MMARSLSHVCNMMGVVYACVHVNALESIP